jgi:hypothetical protein
MLQLQRNVPPPRGRRIREGDARKKYPFERMQVDDFFFIPGRKHSSIRTYFITAGAKYGIKLRSDQIYAREVGGLWKPCEKDDPGAKSGVGVWRIE